MIADQTLRNLRGLASRVISYSHSIRPGNHHRKPVIIFGQGRSGSTLLESLLESTGYFCAQGELLGNGQSDIHFPRAYLNGQARRSNHKHLLCHVKIYHLTRDRERAGTEPIDPREFLHDLADKGWRIIYLRRSDRVRHVLSGLVAQARRDHHKFDDRPERVRIVVDRDELEAWLSQRLAFEKKERDALSGLNFHEIVYERDLEDQAVQQETVDRALDFLGLPRRPASTAHRKINARPLSHIVRNYEEFAGWVRELGWEKSLRLNSARKSEYKIRA